MQILEIEFDLIKRECSEIVNLYKKHLKFFYRGSKDVEKEKVFIKKYPFPFRRPKDTPESLNLVVNKIFNEIGFSVNRYNSVFVTPNLSTAKNYGKPYIFFPKNGFKYLWSPEISDFYFFYRYGDSLLEKLNEISKEDDIIVLKIDKNSPNFIRNLSNFYIIENSNKEKAYKEFRDIIVHALKYELKAQDWYADGILKELKKYKKDFDKIFSANLGIVNSIIKNDFNNHLVSNNMFLKWLKKYFKNIYGSEKLEKVLKTFFSSIYMENREIEKALHSDCEVLFNTEYYYIFPQEHEEDLINLLKNS
ncbi:MAG: hypothetical protein NZZ41_00905 [Candidatus Dojkabacteria bacterium]|nr:hypothetical protein [Candidatus Dojkabacteria bacterium]